MKHCFILFLFTLFSCCPDKVACPRLEIKEWVDVFSGKNLRFESKNGAWVILKMEEAEINQQEQSECEAIMSTSCECPCESSLYLNGYTIKSSNSFSQSILIRSIIFQDLAESNPSNEYRISFNHSSFSSEKYLFDSSIETYQEIGDSLPRSKVVIKYKDVFRLHLNLYGTFNQGVESVYITRNEGIVGFSTIDKEMYYLTSIQ